VASIVSIQCVCVCVYLVQLFISLPNDMGLMNEVKTRSQQSKEMFRSLHLVCCRNR
jgi:hypothetical protein